jgi:hypothetical protein
VSRLKYQGIRIKLYHGFVLSIFVSIQPVFAKVLVKQKQAE